MWVVRAFLIVAVVVSAIAAWVDYKKGEIPAWLTLGTLALGPVANGIYGGVLRGGSGALREVLISIAGAIVCGLVPLFLALRGAGGGGDVKLLAALGALLGPRWGIEAEFYGFMVAALYAPARLVYEGKLLQTLGNTARIMINPFLPKAKRREIPAEMMSWLRLGPAVFVGTCVVALLHWRGL